MPLLRRAILIPVQGLDYSQPSTFINDRNGYPLNVRFLKSEIAKRGGKTLFGATAAADATQIMGFGRILLNSGSSYLVRASKAKLEKYDTATSDWVSIAASNLTGGDNDLVNFINATENELLIITNGVDRIRKWTGAGNNTALAGDPPKAKYCTYLSPYLLLGHIDDGVGTYPWKVQWCDTGDPEEWVTGNAGSEVLADEPSELKNIVKLNEYVAAYKKDSVWLGRKVSTAEVFNFSCIQTGVGLAASRAVVDLNGNHYFMGHNDFYVWNGSIIQPFGSAVRDNVFSLINTDKINNCFAVDMKEEQEIWFFIVETGHTYPNVVYKYNYSNGFWYKDTCSNITAATKNEQVSSLTWADMANTWGDELLRWGDTVTSAGYNELIMGDSSGNTYKLDYATTNDAGSVVSGEFQSKDFSSDQLEFKKRWLQLDVWARGNGTLRVSYSTDYGDNWTYIDSITLTNSTAKSRLYFDIVSSVIRFKFTENTSNGMFYLQNFYPYYVGREEERG